MAGIADSHTLSKKGFLITSTKIKDPVKKTNTVRFEKGARVFESTGTGPGMAYYEIWRIYRDRGY